MFAVLRGGTLSGVGIGHVHHTKEDAPMYPDILASPEVTLALLRQHQRDLQREADHYRVARAARTTRSLWPGWSLPRLSPGQWLRGLIRRRADDRGWAM
jgi:hypothetical protein